MTESDYKALRLMMQHAEGGSRLGKERALKAFEKAWKAGKLRLMPHESKEQRWLRCEARFYLGDYSDWTGWELRDDWAHYVWRHNPHSVPVWSGKEERVLVVGEQGIGDEVFFSQCLFELPDVVFATQKRLVPVYERHGIRCVETPIQGNGRRLLTVPGDVQSWVSLGELARTLRRNRSEFPRSPYLHAHPDQVKRFEKYRGRVGVSWRGAQGQYPWQKFAWGLSLQYDQREDERVERPDLDLRDDIEGLIGLLANLSKLVTVSTSVAHFAAAMGVPVDLIIAKDGGVRKNTLIFPWKWWCDATPGKSAWYGDHVRVYQSIREYDFRRVQGTEPIAA